jgi:hypothetical protein
MATKQEGDAVTRALQERDPGKPLPADSPGAAPLPHERDEQSVPVEEDAQHDHNRQPIAQAHDDVESGQVDTERRGVPNDVPSSRDNATKKR